MVVLDALHWIQGHAAPDLAVRWNCKAAKCGSCSAEVNGRPRLMCKTRLSDFDLDRADHGRADAGVPAHPRPRDRRVLELRGQQARSSRSRRRPTSRRRTGAGSSRTSSGSRSSGSASSASCARTSATCCATTRPSSRSWGRASSSGRAGLEMHPIDTADRRGYLKDDGGIGYCNITKCCTEVCPEHIKITDNAIIPLKERVADEYYDPIQLVWRKLRGKQRPLPMSTASAPGRGPATRPPREASGARRARRRSAGRDEPPGRRALRAPEPPGAGGARRGDVARLRRSAPTARPAAIPGPARPAPLLIDARPRGRARPARPPDASISDYLGIQTNNVAEYTARRPGARARARAGAPTGSTCCSTRSSSSSSSHGRWRVKDAKLQPLWAAAKRDRSAGSGGWSATHVPRAPRTRTPTRLATRRSTAWRRADRPPWCGVRGSARPSACYRRPMRWRGGVLTVLLLGDPARRPASGVTRPPR